MAATPAKPSSSRPISASSRPARWAYGPQTKFESSSTSGSLSNPKQLLGLPASLEIRRDLVHEEVHQIAVGALGIGGVEGELLAPEHAHLAHGAGRAGRAAPDRRAGLDLDHLDFECGVHLRRHLPRLEKGG